MLTLLVIVMVYVIVAVYVVVRKGKLGVEIRLFCYGHNGALTVIRGARVKLVLYGADFFPCKEVQALRVFLIAHALGFGKLFQCVEIAFLAEGLVIVVRTGIDDRYS